MIDHSFVLYAQKEYFNSNDAHNVIANFDVKYDQQKGKFVVHLFNPRFEDESMLAPKIELAQVEFEIDNLSDILKNITTELRYLGKKKMYVGHTNTKDVICLTESKEDRKNVFINF